MTYDLQSRSARRLRSWYRTGKGNRRARVMAHMWARIYTWGILPRRWVTLEVAGAKSGLPRRFPLGMTTVDGRWYLASMLGECQWVRNVRAAGGDVLLNRGRPRPVHLRELPVSERPPILAAFLDQVPGARPHIAVPRGQPVTAYADVAARHPVFLIEPR